MAELRQVSLDYLRTTAEGPILHIKTEEDVDTWKTTQSWRDYAIFLRRLTDSVVGYYLPWRPETLSEARSTSTLMARF